MTTGDRQICFEIMSPRADISSIIVGMELGGFRIDIFGANGDRGFEGDDMIQDRVSHLVSILKNYVGPESVWLEYGTQERVHVWDAICALSDREELLSNGPFATHSCH